MVRQHTTFAPAIVASTRLAYRGPVICDIRLFGSLMGCCIWSLLSLGSVLAQTEEPAVPREVSFLATDGGKIYGLLSGKGNHAVVLCHGARFNKESWSEQAKVLTKNGYEVLAIDFRGYGRSKQGSQGRALHLDVLAAVDFLKATGAKHVSIIGGSMGGGAAAQAAAESKPESVAALILLAAVPIRHPEKMQGRKLFIVAKGDRLKPSVVRQFDAAAEPKKLVVLNGSAHAQHLFNTSQKSVRMQRILDWLSQSPKRP